MKLKHLALAAALMTAAAGASAQVYGELDYSFVSYKESGVPDATTGMLGGNLGYEINKNLALETRAAFGVMDDDVAYRGLNINVKVENTYGFYLKPKFSPAPNLELFAKLGYMHTKVKASALDFSQSSSGNDVAYGLGAQYGFTRQGYVTGGYSRFYDKDSTKLDGWNLGLGYKF